MPSLPRPLRLIPIAAVIALHAHPAMAMSCGKPKGQLQKVICADKDLLKAEEDMARAYFATLLRAPDKEAHDLLQSAQKRWVASREEAWGLEPDEENAYGIDDEELAALLIGDTESHTTFIQGFYGKLSRDRAFVSAFTGGPYAGAKITCDRAPMSAGRGYYLCTGYMSMQHHDRVCTLEIDWATNSDASRRSVQRVTQTGLVGVAVCEMGSGTGGDCQGVSARESVGRWVEDKDYQNRKDYGQAPGPKTRNLAKFAPDLSSFDSEADWLRECLTSKAYPDPKLVKATSE